MPDVVAQLAQDPLGSDPRRRGPKSGSGMGAAWLMIGAVVLGVAIGQGLDRFLDCSPWATLISSLLFLAAGVYLVIRDGGT